MKFLVTHLCAALAFAALGGPAIAGDLTFSFTNPSFGGNALNSSHFLGIANAQRTATASDVVDNDVASGGGDTTTTGTTDADLFVRQLQGRLLSALSAQVTDAIFGENPQEDGTVTFGTTTVTFARTTSEIRLSIIDAIDGSVTDIIVPQLVTN
ncbi:curli assembly protein CsgF [uncultured Sulfitobacter sp.]|uniref:curli assembly protein CsgF n=1 Tax=uncultured Sulfitobacter sp. TaxID=191468 RepID=UPI0026146BC9|nr:curli assembly protein CsgF [uncultured Sulfitobacter sp.]